MVSVALRESLLRAGAEVNNRKRDLLAGPASTSSPHVLLQLARRTRTHQVQATKGTGAAGGTNLKKFITGWQSSPSILLASRR